MKRAIVFICLLALVLTLTSCDFKPRGWWTEGLIAVMADSTDWEPIQGELRFAVERSVRTPQQEKTFRLKHIKGADFNRYTEFRYIILAATLESKGRVGEIVQRVVSDPEVRRRVEAGEQNMFTLQNQWAKDQLMAIMVAKDIPSLRLGIEGNAEFLHDMFDTDFNDRLMDEMFERSEQEELEDRLLTTYGWKIRLQRDYFLVQELWEEGLVWFRRMYPERWIFVRWVDGGDPSQLTAEWVVGERNRIGATYYGGDRVANQYLYSRQGTFLGRPAQITTGLWENDDKVAGGPFRNYTFYDSLSRRTYMIDVAVHAPQRDKQPFLRRIDLIARTFRTIFDGEHIDE